MTIAFLDHHLDNWHAKVFLGLLLERGHEVVAWEHEPANATDWCAANGVARMEHPSLAVGAADAVMVLSPDDIDLHLDLCLEAIPHRKPIFVDKLLMTNVREAEYILNAAETTGTPLTAASSLRHAAELEEALDGPVEDGFFSGYGAWDRYGVHTVAMALRAMGGGVRRLANVGTAAMPTVALEWRDGRRATLVVADGGEASKAFPWRFALRRDGAYAHGTVTRFDEFYRRQLDATLAAFEARTSMDRDEMLDTVRILERAPQAGEGWTEL